MDVQEFKHKLTGWDDKRADERTERWRELEPATYNASLPHLVWRYLTEAEDMYVYGFFIGVIMLCAATLEVALSDQIASRMNIAERDISQFELQQFAILARSLGMIDDAEFGELEKYRLIRNGLIHGNSGKLTRMARKLYETDGFYDKPPVETYLNPATGNGINTDAVRFIQLARNITVRFYGEKTPAAQAAAPPEEQKSGQNAAPQPATA